MTKNQGPKKSTRDRILDAAMELFAEAGYAGARISEIERRSGLSGGSGSLYRHFASKDQLLMAAVEREMTELRAELDGDEALLAAVQDPTERRLRTYELRLRILRRSDRLFRLMLNEGDRVPELQQTIWTVLKLFVRRSPQPDNELNAIAESALGGYHLFSMMTGTDYRGVPEREFLRALVALTEPHRAEPTRFD